MRARRRRPGRDSALLLAAVLLFNGLMFVGPVIVGPGMSISGNVAAAQGESGDPSPSAEPFPAASALADAPPELEDAIASTMPVVPVTGFWSKRDGIRKLAIMRALESGQSDGFTRVVVEKDIAEPLAAALGIELHPDVRRFGLERLTKAVSKGALGLVAATSLRPSMRALEVGGASLTGVERVDDLAAWPLNVELELPPEEALARLVGHRSPRLQSGGGDTPDA